MSLCLFVSDLHGSTQRIDKLFELIRSNGPDLVLIGGDLLPFAGTLPPVSGGPPVPFISGYLAQRCRSLQHELAGGYPLFALILGNDDPRSEEEAVKAGERAGLWCYLHNRRIDFRGHPLFGYACIPPSPFMLKDWERYDVSRYVDVGSSPPTDGWKSVPGEPETTPATIQEELEQLTGEEDLSGAILLFHVPPYASHLDLADLEGRMVDAAPLDVHVGSIAVRRFIEQRRPYLTLHGHVHESARLSGRWRQRIGSTWCLSAAHDGPDLAVVRFPLENPSAAERLLL
jgi:Icc-related predicted phosphoesterase